MRKILVFLLVTLFALGACSAKKPVTLPTDDYKCPLDSPADLKNIPQNLEIFAAQAGKDRRLLSPAEQARLNNSFNNILFGPWHMSKTSVSKRDAAMPAKARGYKDGTNRWTQEEWDAIRMNANMGSFPSRAQKAIALRNTNLREMPTHEPRFSKPTPNVRENPFDYFQYSLIHIGSPLLIAHTSIDGRWHYVESPVAGGWVDAADVAFIDDSFASQWQNREFGAFIRDSVRLPGAGKNGGDAKGDIGSTLPVVSSGAREWKILVPTRDPSGFASAAETVIPAGSMVKRPFALTPGNVAKVGNVMRGQSYGWGGMLGERDCSAMIRDLFAPFGLWLPRNSASQAKRGSVIPIGNLSPQEKAEVILSRGVPFLSLLGMKGHITLYVGKWENKPAIFHNVWGVRIVKDGDDNERLVIGRAVITSITPGIELENLYRPVTFVDRLRSLTIIGR